MPDHPQGHQKHEEREQKHAVVTVPTPVKPQSTLPPFVKLLDKPPSLVGNAKPSVKAAIAPTLSSKLPSKLPGLSDVNHKPPSKNLAKNNR